MMASNNMYRVGDYVYFETSATAPFQIRRIEELNKSPTGVVEAKVICYYRRRDISSTLVHLADKHQNFLGYDEDDEEEDDVDDKTNGTSTSNGVTESNGTSGSSVLTELQKHQLKHREVFLSRQLETLPATHIRGKCSVVLFNETEILPKYLDREDAFFYQLVYDPGQKTLLADRGEIRIGTKWQAEVTPLLTPDDEDSRGEDSLATLVWSPPTSFTTAEMDHFALLARSVGTLARAYEASSAVRQPSLVSAAAAASRDVTHQQALHLLHAAGYDTGEAISALLPGSQPLLCRDEMEEWSASEGNLFEEALGKYGKEFHDLRSDFLPWKSMQSIVEYYYMWKTTDRYVRQKRAKVQEAEHKLKQVYIPNYNKPNPAVLYTKTDSTKTGCESCIATTSPQWYAWGPQNLLCRLCANCWSYWKKYGGLKNPGKMDRFTTSGQTNGTTAGGCPGSFHCTYDGCNKEFRLKQQLDRHQTLSHGLPSLDSTSPPIKSVKQSRGGTSCLHASPLHRLARLLCSHSIPPRRMARRPSSTVLSPGTLPQIRQQVQSRLSKIRNPQALLNFHLSFPPLCDVITRLHKTPLPSTLPSFLSKTPSLKNHSKVAFPADAETRRRSMVEADTKSHHQVNGEGSVGVSTSQHVPIMKKRALENGGSSPCSSPATKRALLSSSPSVKAATNGIPTFPLLRQNLGSSPSPTP